MDSKPRSRSCLLPMDIRERNINNIIVISFCRQIHERSAEGADAAETVFVPTRYINNRADQFRREAKAAAVFPASAAAVASFRP